MRRRRHAMDFREFLVREAPIRFNSCHETRSNYLTIHAKRFVNIYVGTFYIFIIIIIIINTDSHALYTDLMLYGNI